MREWQKWVVVIIELVLIVAAVIFVISVMRELGIAEEGAEERWVLCRPGSYVNVREKPKKTGAEGGRLECGDRIRTDGKIKNGYLHIVDAGTEQGDGWIHTGYIVDDKPEIRETEMVISGKGRVACRRWVGGKRKSWAKPGSAVKVYAIGGGWAVTNRGFIQSEYLEEEQR